MGPDYERPEGHEAESLWRCGVRYPRPVVFPKDSSHQCSPAPYATLVEDGLDVILNGQLGNAQLAGNLVGRQALQHHPDP